MAASKYDGVFSDAVAHYWAVRMKSAGISEGDYGGRRAEVVGGKQLDGLAATVRELLVASGVPSAWVHTKGRAPVLPGWFRATKNWDLLVVDNSAPHDPRLRIALELKVLGGPSYGNNANNRVEEALGNAVDLWTAFREGSYLHSPEPCLAYLMMVEDSPKARGRIRVTERHFPVHEDFKNASYVGRMCILGHRLVSERHYQAVCILASETPPSVQAEESEANTTEPEIEVVVSEPPVGTPSAREPNEEVHGNYSVPDPIVGPERFFETLIQWARPL